MCEFTTMQTWRELKTDLEEHEVELAGSQDFLTHQTVGILFHAALLGKNKQLASHQAQLVEFFHI